MQQAYKTRWVVNCEPSLASADHVIKYLGQYTHRVAITNRRILNTADGKVTFIAKDYCDGAVKKPVTLDGVEHLRRFTLHILPSRFVKIRRYQCPVCKTGRMGIVRELPRIRAPDCFFSGHYPEQSH